MVPTVDDGKRAWHMGISRVLRIIATICFVLAVFGIVPAPVLLVPLGLALWCGSTLVA